MNPDQVKLRYLKAKLAAGRPFTRDEKQWVIDKCIQYGSRVAIQARLAAHREGFRTTGLLVA